MITQSHLKKWLHYDPQTGIFTWAITHSPVKAGDVAGSIHHSGYVVIRHFGKLYIAHRLAVLYMTGDWPNEEVDHKNGKRSDNRWINLRQCSVSQNRMNNLMDLNYTSSITGVRWRENDKLWIARINVRGKDVYLGCFREKDPAVAARRMAEDKYFGEFRRAA